MNRGQLINLDRLAEEDILGLIKLRLNAASIPDELLELIKRRTEGNPFFIIVFNTPSACGGVIDLFILGPGLALGFNTFY